MAVIEPPGIQQEWPTLFENHTIPEIKVLEKQLRSSVIRDKEKLRILVGGNYRELLSTADVIVELDTRSRQTEDDIVELSSKCKPPESIPTAEDRLQHARKAAQLHLLSHCTLCATQLLRSHQLLLSAQLCLLARLLVKSLAETAQPPAALDGLRSHAQVLRLQLMRQLDSQLTHPRSSLISVTEAICAISLIKSISAVDAIAHFRNLRLSRLQLRFRGNSYNANHVKESVQYLVATSQLLRSLLSRGLNDVLTSLQRQPILNTPAISQMEALGLEEVRAMIPSDVLAFTPYIKRIVLERNDVNTLLREWTADASRIASTGMTHMLESVKSVGEVLDLRKILLSMILPVYFSTSAQHVLLQSIRDTTNQKLHDLIKTQNERVLEIVHEMFNSESHATIPPSMWEEAFVQRPLASSSADFLRQVQGRHLGTQGSLSRSLKKLKSWTKSFKLVQGQIRDARSVRWQDIMEEADGADEETAKEIIKLLSETDPANLESNIDQTTRKAITKLNDLIEQQVNNVVSEQGREVSHLIFLLRAIRESTAIIGQGILQHRFDTTKAYTNLYNALAEEVARRIIRRSESSPFSVPQAMLTVEDLPSPHIFALLRDVCVIMEEMGGADAWSIQAVSITKRHLKKALLSDDRKLSWALNDFDKQYLTAALSENTQAGAEDVDVSESAAAYWHRTRLLFGPLT